MNIYFMRFEQAMQYLSEYRYDNVYPIYEDISFWNKLYKEITMSVLRNGRKYYKVKPQSNGGSAVRVRVV